MDVFERTVDAALAILSDAAVDDLLGLLTVEALRNQMSVDAHADPPPSSRTIAATFPGSPGDVRFSRTALVEAVLARAIDTLIKMAHANADGYEMAADIVARGGGPEAVMSAISRDYQAYQPGAELATTANERAFHLCLAMADDQPALARQLRQFLHRHGEAYAQPLEVFGKVFNRRLASGVTIAQLHMTINAYMRGIQLYLRFGADIDVDTISRTVIRLYWSHTTPIAGPERNPVVELWGGVNPRVADVPGAGF